ncbi:hypothetical protein CDV36_009221 [Fusarium kuroshium]|uniref:Aminotransferase class I/classII large domain-containing protein n=1 Tax=Fusarium kuroshium TaxID=2010991 RepID=A0A3M2S0S8_9HYPO|nr:hypothetical protein CDV36_009221 [Fusarium kuroshium]
MPLIKSMPTNTPQPRANKASEAHSPRTTYSKSLKRELNPDTEGGHNHWRKRRHTQNIRMAGGVVRYVPLSPPADGDTAISSSGDWTLDMEKLKSTFNSKTRMLVLNYPHNPVGKVFSTDELSAIGKLRVKHNTIIIADDVYYSLTQDILRHGLEDWIPHRPRAFSQEACASGYELAQEMGFWDKSREEMQGKINRFVQVLEELSLPYTDPQGGYFVLVNFSRLKFPQGYEFPSSVASRPRDFTLIWFLVMELGLAAIPPSEFYLLENSHVAENFLRFVICKEDSVLEDAKERRRGLKKYLE